MCMLDVSQLVHRALGGAVFTDGVEPILITERSYIAFISDIAIIDARCYIRRVEGNNHHDHAARTTDFAIGR
jgi:hypothetical protein